MYIVDLESTKVANACSVKPYADKVEGFTRRMAFIEQKLTRINDRMKRVKSMKD